MPRIGAIRCRESRQAVDLVVGYFVSGADSDPFATIEPSRSDRHLSDESQTRDFNAMATVPFTNPQEAEQAFYEAFQRADLDAMMAVWAEDDEVYCVHPGGPRLNGLDRIRESFRQIFSNGATMHFQLRGLQQVRGGLLAVHSVYEAITLIGDRRTANAVVATNIYANVGGGWRMVAHHASPVASAEAAQPPVESPPAILH